jgi:hypothetical protein
MQNLPDFDRGNSTLSLTHSLWYNSVYKKNLDRQLILY